MIKEKGGEIYEKRRINPNNQTASLKLISRIEASLYTTVTTAICILCGVIASLIFRERNKVYAYIAAILAIIAVVI